MSASKTSGIVQTSLLAVTQTALGCGIGLLLAGKLARPAQKTTAATLFSVGLLLALPIAAGMGMKVWNRPTTERNVRRRLAMIRGDSGLPDEVEIF